ncbi:hypothetical protein CPB83DRAFT_840965 [Crepidotus variabilis]|uniref:MYND-type domain-containing protein n=1 Tax=Crepidotus variabilis TaxID=179855 RepID=A0A9P6JI77_9AGAR|nr:hypothetical protein CPB83DRAFT_840965 [Crepidotus variabilis]
MVLGTCVNCGSTREIKLCSDCGQAAYCLTFGFQQDSCRIEHWESQHRNDCEKQEGNALEMRLSVSRFLASSRQVLAEIFVTMYRRLPEDAKPSFNCGYVCISFDPELPSPTRKLTLGKIVLSHTAHFESNSTVDSRAPVSSFTGPNAVLLLFVQVMPIGAASHLDAVHFVESLAGIATLIPRPMIALQPILLSMINVSKSE